jgi:hypothetical protein
MSVVVMFVYHRRDGGCVRRGNGVAAEGNGDVEFTPICKAASEAKAAMATSNANNDQIQGHCLQTP